ncbi:MAG: HD-GYP domain-containing protein [Sphingomonadales bacterium]|nr:HD-GYP domain-containing protein [Sphingomonadales bacterium]
MLVRVAKQDVRLGMYVHAIEGSWMDHPFWRSRFLLSDQAQLDQVFASNVDYLVIDATRGLDPTLFSPDPEQSAKAQDRPPLSARERITELRKATNTIKRSKVAVMGLFEDARLGKAVQTDSMGPIVEEISQSVSRDPAIILNIAKLKTKDEYTYLHSVAVCALMINLARTMGLDEALTQEIGMAGLLHDVGKMAIPETILKKPERLDEDEMETVRNHPQRGHDILSASSGVSETALDVCLHHHEKMDGTGYPKRLPGKSLSLFARMSSVCDVYDAVTSQRPYNTPWSASHALQLMQGWEGHFDPEIVDAFIESLGILPVGTLIRVNDDRLAIVTGESPSDFTLPRARIFYSPDRGHDEPLLDIEVSRNRGGWSVAGIEDPSDWGFPDWKRTSRTIITRKSH